MKFILAIGNTETARIDGISAAGEDPDLMVHTPSADAEILTYGRPTQAPVVPVSPSGCPTPAVITRAVRELVGFDPIVVDTGTASTTSAPTVTVPGAAGNDIRESVAVPQAAQKIKAAKEYGRSLPDEQLILAESIPGGTTTAMAVLTALGEQPAVSSSLPQNPLELKREVVDEGLTTSELTAGALTNEPIAAIRAVGDPVLAVLVGIAIGALETGTEVLLGGGTQMSAVAALLRHTGRTEVIAQATTTFVTNDETAAVRGLADRFDIELEVTDPEFTRRDHPALIGYRNGEAKEGVGMGGALWLLADEYQEDQSIATLHDQIITVYERLTADE